MNQINCANGETQAATTNLLRRTQMIQRKPKGHVGEETTSSRLELVRPATEEVDAAENGGGDECSWCGHVIWRRIWCDIKDRLDFKI